MELTMIRGNDLFKVNPFHIFAGFLWNPLHSIVNFLPMRTAFKAAELIAHGVNLLPTPMRRRMRREIKKTMPWMSDNQIADTAKRSMVIFTKRQVENLIIGTMDKNEVIRRYKLSGEENLKRVLQEGRGGIILLSHFGSFLMVLPALFHRGYRINQLAGQPIIRNRFERKLFELRKKESDKLAISFFRSDMSLRPVIRALRNNELVAIALDGREGANWVKVDFLKQTANIAAGFMRIADISGAAVIPTFAVRKDRDKNRIFLEKPIFMSKYTDRKRYYHEKVQELARCFEQYIYRFPCHFGMTLAMLRRNSEKNTIEVPLFENHDAVQQRKN